MMQKEKDNAERHRLNELRMQLKAAIKTLKRQPYQKGDKPNGILTSWPLHSGKNNVSGDMKRTKYIMKSTPNKSHICNIGLIM